MKYLTASGQRKWVLETGQGVYANEKLQALEGVIFDINFLKESELKVNYLKRHDIWTGLYNRNHLAHNLKNDINKLVEQKKCIIVINISELSTTTNFFESQNIVKNTASALTAYCNEDCQLYKTFLNRITFYLKRYSIDYIIVGLFFIARLTGCLQILYDVDFGNLMLSSNLNTLNNLIVNQLISCVFSYP